jgi:NADH:ubiquinone oxidoreductase subunit 2 (subunit N)
MTSEILKASLHLSLPELILAVGAMVLLMIGAYIGRSSHNLFLCSCQGRVKHSMVLICMMALRNT